MTETMNVLDIWEPRWHDKVVLIAKHKVGKHNVIKFTKTKSLPGLWYVSGKTIKASPLETNGKIPCYAVSLNDLEKE